jgi:two-component system, chemotaxis family, CheB/CheR fusion protein
VNERAEAAEQATDPDLEALLEFIRDSRGFDFTGYKRASLRRRIERRMQELEIGDLRAYRDHLEANQDEFAALFDTILINVTSFFRDGPTWEFLAAEAVPRLVEARSPEEPIRVWSAGCASGEEAYTIAFLLAEALGPDAFRERVKVYATDVDEAALADARHATYDARAVADLPDGLRERYFEASGESWVVRPEIRRALVFGRHDLVRDPPISRVDLLLCRNTLMYFAAPTQVEILADFQFALNEGGYLVLGKSEMFFGRSRMFDPVDLSRRVFRRPPGAEGAVRRRAPSVWPSPTLSLPDPDEEIQHASFEAGPVAHFVVDEQGRLAVANLPARRLFALARDDFGAPIQDLELSYRPVELRSRLEEVARDRHPVTVRGIEWAAHGARRWFDLHLSPLHGRDGALLGTGVTFTDVTAFRDLHESYEDARARLETAYEELQSTAEELETTNEELQSTNEELETTNEELQSTNEELETMNEELQTTNEELASINDELRSRTGEVAHVNGFLASILAGLDAGVVVADEELVVRAWNAQAAELWGLREDEVRGRHLLNLDVGLRFDDLAPLIRGAAGGGPAGEGVVDAVNRRGQAIRCRVRSAPLRTPDGGLLGVLVQMEELAPDRS